MTLEEAIGVLESINAKTDYLLITDDTRSEAMDMAISALQEQKDIGLPSAQPDGIPLEWIDKHLEWLDNCDNDFAQLAKVSIRAMVDLWKKDRT